MKEETAIQEEEKYHDVDFGDWSIPTSWEDLTLKQLQEITKYYNGQEEGKDVDLRDIIHILCNKTKDEVMALPMAFLDTILERLTFLTQPLERKQPTNTITLGGETYTVHNDKQLKTGEYVAVQMALKGDPENVAAILAIVCRKEGEEYDSTFENEVLDERIKMWEEAPAVEAMRVVDFFLQTFVLLQTPSLLCSNIEEALNHMYKIISTSETIGPLSRRYMISRVNRLRKSLASTKSTRKTTSNFLHIFKKKGKRRRRIGNTEGK